MANGFKITNKTQKPSDVSNFLCTRYIFLFFFLINF